MIKDKLEQKIRGSSYKWLVSGVAGFIGSNILRYLLDLDQQVLGIDNFSTGSKKNLEDVEKSLPAEKWKKFTFRQADIRDSSTCTESCRGVDIVLHQAALGSVSRSVLNPIETHQVNADGFLNMLIAAKDATVKRFVYASSSSVYGDVQALPKVEEQIGKPLSPYAASKLINEIYAAVFASLYGFSSIGLRYFNVFGPRQNPQGDYAAVIPRWIKKLLNNEQCEIYGDGKTSRDFCHIDNVVKANLLAAFSDAEVTGASCLLNIGSSKQTQLNQLYGMIRREVSILTGSEIKLEPLYKDFRSGDVRDSLASIDKARQLLDFDVETGVEEGIRQTALWFYREQS